MGRSKHVPVPHLSPAVPAVVLHTTTFLVSHTTSRGPLDTRVGPLSCATTCNHHEHHDEPRHANNEMMIRTTAHLRVLGRVAEIPWSYL